MTSLFNLEFEELTNIEGIPKDNFTFKINVDDLTVDWDDELGSGSFAQVYRGWYLWTEVAVKRMMLPIEEQEKVLLKYIKREVVLLNILKHPNIVQFLGWCHPEETNHLLLVEEFIKGGTLQNYINKKVSKDMWHVKVSLCMDVAKAMLYLHKNKVVYRDLKCDNILIDDHAKPRFAKLVDFGFARMLEEQQRKGPPLTICGTDDWMAPEVILGMDYDERSDVFSFGVVLLECLLGTENVKNKLARKAFNSFELNTELARSMVPVSCPEELIELTLSCCSYDPTARPDFHEILTILTNIQRRVNDNIAVVSDVSTTDYTDASPRRRGTVDLSSQTSDDESSSGPASATGSRESPAIPSSPPIPLTPLDLDPRTSPLSKSSPITRRADGHRYSTDGIADDEADDLRRRISQSNLGSPTSRQVSFVNPREASRDELRSSTNLLTVSLGYEGHDKKDYIRVESLVDAFTVWNVRVGPGSTVADVCENLGKKIDAKYKYIELYQLHKRKRLCLFPEQFIDQLRAHWGGDPNYKFGVVYRTKEDTPEMKGTGSKKWNSIGKSAGLTKSSTKKSSKDKKKTIAMSVNFSMTPM